MDSLKNTMVNINVSQKVKDMLQKFKEKEQCKTFSEAIRILLMCHNIKEKSEK